MPQKKTIYENVVQSLSELSVAQKKTERRSQKTDQRY